MYKKRVRQLITAFKRLLSGEEGVSCLVLDRSAAAALPDQWDYSRRLEILLTRKDRLTCAAVLEQCRDTLDALSPTPEEGWLSYTYQFACARMFPHAGNEALRRRAPQGAIFFLCLLQVLFEDEAEHFPFSHQLDIPLLAPQELDDSPHAQEYRLFVEFYRREFVYEMMRLGLEATPFRTLEHIAGVHFIAMSAARDLKRSGFPVDLALVSAGTIGHDIGKFGCREGERVPYLHYYYTEQWFHTRGMEAIGHIAANHSVWDLELDNLSTEALLLIYADFRSKEEREPNGTSVSRIYSLADAFSVILGKLDSVDDAKRTRYIFVYERLRDFETYLVAQGVDITLSGKRLSLPKRRDTVLLEDQEVVKVLKLDSVEHNLLLMHRLSDQRSFSAIVEEARGETRWTRLRAYLSVFDSSSIYLNTAQKEQLLAFLYELLMHREGDIRRQAAHLMGDVIANFHAGYVKERPAHYQPDLLAATDLSLARRYTREILYPDHKLLPQHKRWLNFTLKMVVTSLLEHCEPSRQSTFLDILLELYQAPEAMDDTTAFTLLDTAVSLPLSRCSQAQLQHLCSFVSTLVKRDSLMVRGGGLELLHLLVKYEAARPQALDDIRTMSVSDNASLSLLQRQILEQWTGGSPDRIIAGLQEEDISARFLENLKAATPWIIKKANIHILTDFARINRGHLLHIATHLSNLLMLGEQVTVRLSAGEALLAIAPLLSSDQRGEVAVELSRGIETGQPELSKYIPDFLGRFYLFLPPSQLEEGIQDLHTALCSPNSFVAAAAIASVGVLYERYGEYRDRFPEADDVFRDRRERLLGMLLKALASFHFDVRHEALLALGDHVFGSGVISVHEQRRAFSLSAKKLLFLLHEEGEDSLSFFYRCAALSRIYRFITREELLRGKFHFQRRDKIAFFPGTFDPFTLSHKGIVQAILEQGFEVILAIDEFSWSKKTQPHRIRRQIASVSVADLFHVHIFPEDFPVNIANPENLAHLRRAFPGREIYMVVGSDVVTGASSYRAPPSPDSIHSFPHVIFRREGKKKAAAARAESRIQAPILHLSLPAHLEDISSTRFRDAIDANRDVSHLIDPLAQEYIYRNSLYLREPLNKPVLEAEDLTFLTCTPEDPLPDSLRSGETLCRAARKLGDTILIMRKARSKSIKGFLALNTLESKDLLSRLRDTRLSAFIRRSSSGKVLVISGIHVPKDPQQADFCQFLLTEAIADALSRGCTYAFFCPADEERPSYVFQALSLQGFIPGPANMGGGHLMVVDMHTPIVLTRNMDTVLKPPLADNPRVQAVLTQAHQRLQKTLTGMYPGSLVLSISSAMLHRRLVSRIAACNGVSPVPSYPRVLGPCICVPYGKILRGTAVPNTVTKTIHTDLVWERDLSASSVAAFPGYSPLPYQARTIRAFRRPLILVDDMLHDGKSARALIPLLRQEHAEIRQVLVGCLTGMGRDIMEEMGCPVDCVYYLPNLRLRFVESALYPFIGGDRIRRAEPLPGGGRPAINRVFPYAAPDYSEDCTDGSTYLLSLCCLENARDILLTLEAEYRALYARNLTLGRLGEAILSPLIPDKGACMAYDRNRAASTYVENDIEMLKRLQSTVKIVIGGASNESK